MQPAGLLFGPQPAAPQTGAATVTRSIGNDKPIAAGERAKGEGDFLRYAAKSMQHDDRWPVALIENMALAAVDAQAVGGIERPVYGAVILRMRYVCHGGAGTPVGGLRLRVSRCN